MRKSLFPSTLGAFFALGLGASASPVRARDEDEDEDLYAGITKHTFPDRLESTVTERRPSKPAALGMPYGLMGFGGRPEHPSKRRAPEIDPTSGRQKVSLKTMSNRQRAMYEAALRRRARQLGKD